jgi:hypothetical protein
MQITSRSLEANGLELYSQLLAAHNRRWTHSVVQALEDQKGYRGRGVRAELGRK